MILNEQLSGPGLHMHAHLHIQAAIWTHTHYHLHTQKLKKYLQDVIILARATNVLCLYFVSIFKTFPWDHAVWKHWFSSPKNKDTQWWAFHQILVRLTWLMTPVETQGHSSIGTHSMPMHSDPGKPTQKCAPQRSPPMRGLLVATEHCL